MGLFDNLRGKKKSVPEPSQDSRTRSHEFLASYMILIVHLAQLSFFLSNVSDWMSASRRPESPDAARMFSGLSIQVHDLAANLVSTFRQYGRDFPLPGGAVRDSTGALPNPETYIVLLLKQYGHQVLVTPEMTQSHLVHQASEIAGRAFQESLLAVQAAMREGALREAQYLCRDDGVVWRLACMDHMLQSIEFTQVQDAVTFFPDSDDRQATSALMHSSFDGEVTKYIPSELTLVRTPNDEGNIPTGQVVQFLGRQGVFVPSGFPEEQERVAALVRSWLVTLRQELFT